MQPSDHYLPSGLPTPVPESDELSRPYWDGLRVGKLFVQRCGACATWQWGPEWICHRCRSFEMAWVQVEPRGRIYSWERCWHAVHPALQGHSPYLVVLVELPAYGGIRLLGNLLGDPMQEVAIGTAVHGVFEHHPAGAHPYSLLQWQPE